MNLDWEFNGTWMIHESNGFERILVTKERGFL
jgi:hypothetical protein